MTSKLIKAGLLDAKTVSVFNREVYDWRFGKRKLSMRSNLASPALVPPPAVARPCGKSAAQRAKRPCSSRVQRTQSIGCDI